MKDSQKNKRNYIYLSFEDVSYIHNQILLQEAWLPWIKDVWQLESILYHIQNDEYYPDFTDKLVHLVFWIIQFHVFNDANKRTAILSSKVFLEINWIKNINYTQKMEDIVVWIAKWIITKNDLKKIFQITINI